MGCVFPWGALAATALVEVMAGTGGAEARATCKPGLLPISVVVSALLGKRSGPEGLGPEGLGA